MCRPRMAVYLRGPGPTGTTTVLDRSGPHSSGESSDLVSDPLVAFFTPRWGPMKDCWAPITRRPRLMAKPCAGGGCRTSPLSAHNRKDPVKGHRPAVPDGAASRRRQAWHWSAPQCASRDRRQRAQVQWFTMLLTPQNRH
jgi:hypothetical protein